MNIISALMKTLARVSYGNRWIVFDEMNEEWVVYEHKYAAKNSDVICRSMSQDEAVKYLLDKEDEE